MRIGQGAARFALALASSFPPALAAQSQDPDATAHRLVIRSGLAVQLRGFAAQVDSEIRQNPAGLDPRIVSSLSTAARQAFRADALQEDMTRRVTKKLTVADMQAALVWLETPLGRRITLAEELASATLDPQVLVAFAERQAQRPPAPERAALIAELLSATQAVRAAQAAQEAMALGVATGMDSLQPREKRLGEAELRIRLRQAMPPEQVRAILGQQLPLIYAYTYRDVSDADLAAYVRFLRSASGKRYQDGVTGALIEGLARAGVRVGELAGEQQQKTAL
jgi:hypothetical protein